MTIKLTDQQKETKKILMNELKTQVYVTIEDLHKKHRYVNWWNIIKILIKKQGLIILKLEGVIRSTNKYNHRTNVYFLPEKVNEVMEIAKKSKTDYKLKINKERIKKIKNIKEQRIKLKKQLIFLEKNG